MSAGTDIRWRPRRLVYLGTPEIAVPPLRALVDAGFEVLAVVTRVDARRGRGSELTPSPVKRVATELGIPVLHRADEVVGLGAELGVVVAYGRLIAVSVLEAVPMVNLHFSLLPRWRGAAPVERALLAGDETTGVCLMRLDEGLDTGPVHACAEVPIGPTDTADDLRHRLVQAGCELLVAQLSDGLGEPSAQQGEPTYAAKLDVADRELAWDRTAEERSRTVRLGGAFTWFRGKRLRVVRADVVDRWATGSELIGDVVGGLRLLEVQPESKSAMSFASFANGARPAPGEHLGR